MRRVPTCTAAVLVRKPHPHSPPPLLVALRGRRGEEGGLNEGKLFLGGDQERAGEGGREGGRGGNEGGRECGKE